MKEKINIAISVFVGVVFAGLLFWLISTTIELKSTTAQIVSFINSNIQASKSATTTPSPTK